MVFFGMTQELTIAISMRRMTGSNIVLNRRMSNLFSMVVSRYHLRSELSRRKVEQFSICF